MPTDRKPSAIVHAPPAGRRKPLPDPEPPAAIHRSQATSKAFWALMDRWGVPDVGLAAGHDRWHGEGRMLCSMCGLDGDVPI